MSSNVTAMDCTKDQVYILAANGAEWTVTRAEIMAIYQTKTGSAAARRQATITDVLALGKAALGDYLDTLLMLLDFDPADSNKQLLASVG